jgi:uncharacterized linocin/CFP29 family protein
MQDMELMGMFAHQAAMAIDQSQQIDHIEQALVRGLSRLVKADTSQPSSELMSVLDKSLNEENNRTDLLELADLFNHMSALGEAERRLCLQILQTFVEYRKSTTSPRRFR